MAVLESVKLTLASIGHPVFSDESIGALMAQGLSLVETFRIVAPDATPQLVAQCVDAYRRHYRDLDQDHTVVFDGVSSTLAELAAAGFSMAVVSNKGTAAVVRALQRFGIEQGIDHVFGAEDGLPTKPDPSLYELRIQPAYPAVPKSAFLMIGDTVADLEFVKTVGIAGCWASYGFGDPASCRGLHPDFTIGHFAELAAIVA